MASGNIEEELNPRGDHNVATAKVDCVVVLIRSSSCISNNTKVLFSVSIIVARAFRIYIYFYCLFIGYKSFKKMIA